MTDERKPYSPPAMEPVDILETIAHLREENTALRAALQFVRAEYELQQAAVARIAALGSGPGYIMGDDTLVTLAAVRAALRGS